MRLLSPGFAPSAGVAHDDWTAFIVGVQKLQSSCTGVLSMRSCILDIVRQAERDPDLRRAIQNFEWENDIQLVRIWAFDPPIITSLTCYICDPA